MPYDIVMPQLGLTMTEGAVTAWWKKTGDRVEKGETLFTVETDKVEMEVESPAAGYVAAILLEPSKLVPTGTRIAVLADSLEEIPAVSAQAADTGNPPPPDSPSAVPAASVPVGQGSNGQEGSEYPASPRARRLARELGIDIRLVKPARGIRVIEEDVERFRAAHAAEAPPAEKPVPPGGLSAARRLTADRMAKSFQSAPHFYLGIEVNAADLVRFRESLVEVTERSGSKLTYTDLFIKALARALGERPALNAWWSEGTIVSRPSVDIGFAVQTDDALLAPVIRNADSVPLLEIARRRSELAAKARSGKLTPADMEGGSATLSNLGQFGVDWFQAILNPPQSVLLAAGRIARRPVAVGDRVEVRPTVTLTLSADHRVLDGAAGASLLGRIRELLEKPALLLV